MNSNDGDNKSPKTPRTPETPVYETPGKMGPAWNRLIVPDKVSAFILGPTGSPAKTPMSAFNKQASKNVEGHSPFKEKGTPGSTEKSAPKSIYTESHEKLQLIGVFDDLAVYARIPESTREPSLATLEEVVKKHISESDENKDDTNAKVQTYDSQTAARPIRKKGRSQKKTMGNVSAKEVVHKIFDIDTVTETLNKMDLSQEAREAIVNRFEDFSAEWLHLIDYAKVGEARQIRANLVAGSKEANSTMMIIESYTNDQIAKGKKVYIEVKAMIAKDDIAKKIIMRVTTEDPKSTTEIIINPFTKMKPAVQSKPYFDIRQQIKGQDSKLKK
ncbi:MAG TPA: hypothetical protein VGV92_05300 [Gammaproteobacteria bacterium]|nr:hypothetical protein [Gammaproteobacteria bacterium]